MQLNSMFGLDITDPPCRQVRGGPCETQEAEESFAAVREAYDTLSDPVARDRYDQRATQLGVSGCGVSGVVLLGRREGGWGVWPQLGCWRWVGLGRAGKRKRTKTATRADWKGMLRGKR